MGLINKLFGNKTVKKNKVFIDWITLTNNDQLNEIKKLSNNEPILIFKHSTRCGISSMVKKQFEKLFNEEHNKMKVYYLDLLNYRNLSNKISEDFNVVHQSPQLLVIKNNLAVFNASHYDIVNINLTSFM